jgi:hypothetical protein
VEVFRALRYAATLEHATNWLSLKVSFDWDERAFQLAPGELEPIRIKELTANRSEPPSYQYISDGNNTKITSEIEVRLRDDQVLVVAGSGRAWQRNQETGIIAFVRPTEVTPQGNRVRANDTAGVGR